MPIKEGERVSIVLESDNEYLLTVKTGQTFSTHRGNIQHADICGKEFGEMISTSQGTRVYILPPGIVENIFFMKRKTQIVYPKDMGFILLMLDVKEGDRIIDVGLGSGSMCGALARLVGECGKVYGYERREEFVELASSNLESWGLRNRVDIQCRDISEGFDKQNADALFLDVPSPWDYIKVCWDALKGGGRLGIVSPTAGKVIQTLQELNNNHFIQIQVWENLFRELKPIPTSFRPFDRMVAHTTYMIFARKVFAATEKHVH